MRLMVPAAGIGAGAGVVAAQAGSAHPDGREHGDCVAVASGPAADVDGGQEPDARPGAVRGGGDRGEVGRGGRTAVVRGDLGVEDPVADADAATDRGGRDRRGVARAGARPAPGTVLR